MFKVEILNAAEVKNFLKQESWVIQGKIRFGLEQFLNKIADTARAIVPVRTGRLQGSLAYEISELGGGKISGKVGTNVKYGKWVEFGTGLYGPHKTVIVPTQAKVLSWRVKGKRVFAKYVKGMRARPFMMPAFEKILPELYTFLKNAMRD